MTEKQPPRTNILPSDIDAQGNVILWDHGPQEPRKIPGETEDRAKARREHYEAEHNAWRKQHGAFHSPEDLAMVKGIGLKTVGKNRDRIVVGAPPRAAAPAAPAKR
jgi:hypothetical protein